MLRSAGARRLRKQLRGRPAGANKKRRNASWTWDVTHELELELIQTQMTQKTVLRAEVYAHALRAS